MSVCVHSKDLKHFLHPLRHFKVCYIFQRKEGQFLVLRRARAEIKNKKTQILLKVLWHLVFLTLTAETCLKKQT